MIRWKSTRSSRWVSTGLRSRVESFALSFVQTHGWAESFTITERFSGNQNRIDIWRRKTDGEGIPDRGPDNEPYHSNVNQSDNTPLLLFRVHGEAIEVEVGCEFPAGRETTDQDLNMRLGQVRLSLEAGAT